MAILKVSYMTCSFKVFMHLFSSQKPVHIKDIFFLFQKEPIDPLFFGIYFVSPKKVTYIV